MRMVIWWLQNDKNRETVHSLAFLHVKRSFQSILFWQWIWECEGCLILTILIPQRLSFHSIIIWHPTYTFAERLKGDTFWSITYHPVRCSTSRMLLIGFMNKRKRFNYWSNFNLGTIWTKKHNDSYKNSSRLRGTFLSTTRKWKPATILEFTTVSAIIFIYY